MFLGVAIIVRTIDAGGGAAAFGILVGVLFVAAGAGAPLPDARAAASEEDSMPRVDTALPQLKRGLGSPALFGIVQGFVGASIYFSVGVVAARALGLTWLVFLAGALFFALIVPCYVEGTSLHQERGGATVIARYAFNELWSFIAGWAICLDYLILIALTAFATTDYVAVFWEPVDSRRAGVPGRRRGDRRPWRCVNVRGSSPRRVRARGADRARRPRAAAAWCSRSGFALVFEPEVLTDPAAIARRAVARGPAVRVPARAGRVQRDRRVLRAWPGRWRSAAAGCGG